MGKLHIIAKSEVKLHEPKKANKTFDDGACLTGHHSDYSETSCSYRWQAHMGDKAGRDGLYKKQPPATAQKVRTSAYKARSGKLYPPQYAADINLPEKPGDWDLGGPNRGDMKDTIGRTIPQSGNFCKNWLWPYWHNSHHLIPKGLFARKVREINSPQARTLVPQALLTAKYNINHHINAFILPQDREVARFLGMPRHLILEDGATVRSKEYFDHMDYNINVEKKLEKVIDDYKQACDKKNNPRCEIPDFTTSKETLEKLSKQCMQKILDFGKQFPGRAISDMPPI